MERIKSYNVQIWCGLKIGYEGEIQEISKAYSICQGFVNDEKDCITVTPTNFFYVNGTEPGFVVGFINYPRFPKKQKDILNKAILLAEKLMKELKQNRVTITTPKHSIMLEKNKNIKSPKK